MKKKNKESFEDQFYVLQFVRKYLYCPQILPKDYLIEWYTEEQLLFDKMFSKLFNNVKI